MKITIELDKEVYDYLKKRAKEMNERMGAEIITAEDMAAGILIARRDEEYDRRRTIQAPAHGRTEAIEAL